MRGIPDTIPVSALRRNARRVLRRVASCGEPVFIARRDGTAAVVVNIDDYERTQRELDILRLLARGEKEIAAGAGYALEDVLRDAEQILES